MKKHPQLAAQAMALEALVNKFDLDDKYSGL